MGNNDIKGKSNEELKAAAAAIDKEIKEREKRIKADAMKKIREIAAQAGLVVEIKSKVKTKRGRPKKVKSDAG